MTKIMGVAKPALEDVSHADVEFHHAMALGEEFLEHHGVKGMKWGVRKDNGHQGEQVKTKKLAKLDQHYQKQFAGAHGWVKVQNAMAEKINPRLDQLNSNPKYKDKNVLDGVNPKLQKQYLHDYEKIIEKSAAELSNDLGVNPSGTRKLVVTRYGEGIDATWAADWAEVKHVNGPQPSLIITPTFDKTTGHITKTSFSVGTTPSSVSHGDLAPEGEYFDHMTAAGEAFLEHHGVKGMKWGVRRGAAGWRDNKVRSLDRVANKQGGTIHRKVDYARAVSTSSVVSLARNGGTRGAARVQANNVHARQARLANGTASRSDKIHKYKSSAGLPGYNVTIGRKDKDTRFTASKDKLTVNANDHAVTKNVKKDHNELSDGEFQRKYNITKSTYRKRVAKHTDPFASAISKHPSNRP